MSFEDRNNIIFNTEYCDFNSYYDDDYDYDCDCDCECENIEFESRNIIIMENEKSDILDLDNLIFDFNNMHI
tara:strand:+ start:1777 stop:1992 length:216 start_codon:yes stop_codon:yes gene_type:complete